MPRLGLVFAGLAVCAAACDKQAAPASGSPSAAPSSAVAAPAAPAPESSARPGFAGAPYAASRTYFKLQRAWPPAWLLCDGVDQPQVLVVGLPDASHNLALIALDKATGGRAAQALKVGEADPGAGNVYWPLSHADGSDAGYLRAFNPGVIDDPKTATTATLTSIRLGQQITSCRWVANTRLLAAGARRSYLITTEGGQLVYRTFDYAQAASAQPVTTGAGMTSTPSLEIRGGQERATAAGRSFTFDNNGYHYLVEIGTAASPRGTVTVTRSGRRVAADLFEAYTIAS